MRTSNRTRILDAAASVVQREGIRSFTFDAVAAEAGLTKGGLMYHFSARDDLVTAVHQHLAARWESAMVAALGRSAEEATDDERYAAYARVNTEGASRAEMLFIIESSTHPEHAAPWEAVMAHWAPPPPGVHASEEELTRFVARLAADGLWMFEVLSNETLDTDLRASLSERLAATVTTSHGPAPGV